MEACLDHIPPGEGAKVVVAMSGGVDSSVAAALLQRRGYDVVGCFMRLGTDDHDLDDEPDAETCTPGAGRRQGCCSVNDAADARLVAARLDAPLYVLNFRRDFDRIRRYFVEAYHAGQTPNPCVRCNDWLKFGKLLNYADSIGARWVASGHYARLDHPGPEAAARHAPVLRRGVDRDKDQSYVLSGLRAEVRRRMLLPVGALRKTEVRAIAASLGLAVHDKPDSQEICFVPDNDYFGVVKRADPERVAPGEMVDASGEVLGEHPGHQRFTIGQRRGLGVARGVPLYVIDKDPSANRVTVGPAEQLHVESIEAGEVNWHDGAPGGPVSLAVQYRAHGVASEATVTPTGESSIRVDFDPPQRAVSPGQAIVGYDGDRVVVGGWITSTRRAEG